MTQTAHAKDKNLAEYLDHPNLKQYIKKIPANHFLFRQGELGNTMFIIVDGTVWLLAEKETEEHVAGVLERGQFLGERAVMNQTPHQRFFSAKAKTYTTVLEFGLEDIDTIQHHLPEIMIDMLRKMFLVAAERLDRSNHMVKILRSSDNVERLVHLILYFSSSSGRVVPEGLEFVLSRDAIHYHIDMGVPLIESCLEELLQKKLIQRLLGDYFLLRNEKALLDYIPTLREIVANRNTLLAQSSGGKRSWPAKLFSRKA